MIAGRKITLINFLSSMRCGQNDEFNQVVFLPIQTEVSKYF